MARQWHSLVAGLLLAAVAVDCSTDIQSGVDSANDLLYRKQYVAAERLYRKLLKRLEDLGDLDEEEEAQRLLVLDRLGKIDALYLHDYSQAIAYYQTLIRLYPRTDQAFAARATIADLHHHKLGDLQAAIDNYQKLVTDFPDQPESRRAQLQISNAYFQLRNYEQARTEAEQLIHRWPQSSESAQARFQIANSYYVQARYTEAIATYERLLEDKSEGSLAALVLFELGNCFQELGQPERALAYYYACLSQHPDPVLVQRKIRRVRTRMHRSSPLPELTLPDYLKTHLSGSRDQRRNSGTQVEETMPDLAEGGSQPGKGQTSITRGEAGAADAMGPAGGTSPPGKRRSKAKRKSIRDESAQSRTPGDEAARPGASGQDGRTAAPDSDSTPGSAPEPAPAPAPRPPEPEPEVAPPNAKAKPG